MKSSNEKIFFQESCINMKRLNTQKNKWLNYFTVELGKMKIDLSLKLMIK